MDENRGIGRFLGPCNDCDSDAVDLERCKECKKYWKGIEVEGNDDRTDGVDDKRSL